MGSTLQVGTADKTDVCANAGNACKAVVSGCKGDCVGGVLFFNRIIKAAQFATGDILWKLANIVLLAVAARVLPEDEAALVVLSQTASMILLSLGDLGFRSAGIRLIAVDKAQTLLVMRAVFLRRLVAALLVGLPGALICAAVLTDNMAAFIGLSLIVLAYLPYFAASDWVLLASGRPGSAGAVRAVYAVILLLLSGLVFINGATLPQFALIIGAGYGGFALVSGLLVRNYVRTPAYTARSPGKAEVLGELGWGASIALAIAFALNTLFHSVEILLAGALLGEAESAAFAAPFRLVFSIYAIGWIISQYCAPRFARLAASSGARPEGHWFYYFSGFAAFGLITAAATYLCTPWLVSLVYGDAFDQAGVLMRALAPTIALDATVACLGTLLVMQNRGKTSAATIGLGCLASMSVFLLCKDYGLMAAVYAKYAAYSALVVTQLFCLSLLVTPPGNRQQV